MNSVVTVIKADAGEDMVQVSANLDRYFPSLVPDMVITERDFALYEKVDKDEMVFAFACRIIGGQLTTTGEASGGRQVTTR